MQNEQQSDLPEELVNAIKRADKPVDLITAKTDREIAALASAHFAAREMPNRRLRPAWAAVAAAVVIAVTFVITGEPEQQAEYSLYADVDGSGQIDIGDVLMLARDTDSFTQEQLDAFAMSIVSLKASSLNTSGDAS